MSEKARRVYLKARCIYLTYTEVQVRWSNGQWNMTMPPVIALCC